MATPLDFGLLQNFGMLFPFLLVLVFAYALLAKTQLFGENKGLYAFIAFVLAVATLLSPIAIKAINRMAPWFVIVFIFAIFVLITYQLFGVEQKTITELLTGKKYGSSFFYWILTIVLIIGIWSLSSVISEEREAVAQTQSAVQNATQPAQQSAGLQSLLNPKVLGMILILLVALFTVKNLTSYEE